MSYLDLSNVFYPRFSLVLRHTYAPNSRAGGSPVWIGPVETLPGFSHRYFMLPQPLIYLLGGSRFKRKKE